MLLALALGCGLVASIGISQVMDRNSDPQVRIETVPVYVALHNINLGDPIESNMISLQEWPKDKAPRGVISKLEDLQGRRPRTAIIEGEPILEAKLLAPGQMADPISQITKGMRLKTIAVDAEKSAAGLLRPGDRVDVQLFVRKDQRTGVDTAKSKIILQNIRVFAVDQAVQRAAEGGEEKAIAKTVSLMLTPEQAAKLSLAEQIGEVSLIPRNPNDEESADWSEYTVDDLLSAGDDKNSRNKEQGIPKTEPAEDPNNSLANAINNTPVPPKEPFRMEVVEAQEVHEVLFDADTGRPVRPVAEQMGTDGPMPNSMPKPKPKSTNGNGNDETPVTDSDASKMLEEFPINFNDANK
jgi:pilus assembly protein CpaB